MQNEQTKELKTIQEKRQWLKDLSAELKPLVEDGTYEKLNDAIIDFYMREDDEIQDFKSYKSWKEEGFQVNKGEKAFIVWSRPKSAMNEEEGKEGDEEETKYFHLAFIFSDKQVRRIAS